MTTDGPSGGESEAARIMRGVRLRGRSGRLLAVGVVVAFGLTSSGCGSSGGPSPAAGGTVTSSSGESVVVQDEHSLERTINREAKRNIRNYFKGKLHFDVYTECSPTTPDNLN